jgi:predicted ATPase
MAASDAVAGQPGGDPGLLERAGELQAIESVLGSARTGSGRCLVFEGGAGLGKSRLAAKAREVGRTESMIVLSARGAELERDFSFGVVLQLFQPLLAEPGAARERLLSGAAQLCEPLFASAPEERRPPAESEFPLFHGLHWLAANASERASLLLLVDDAHWADRPSLHFLLYLLQRLDELPVAVLVTARPQEGGRQAKLVLRIAAHELSIVSSLDPLSDEGVAALVRSELAADVDDELCAACAVATGGNPFYLRQLIATLRSREPSALGDALSLGGTTASSAVLARVAALPEPAPALASAVAVLGDGTPLERAAALAGIDPDEAAAAADALAAAGVLERGARLAFAHPLLRQAVYSQLAEARRARAHARAAEMLRDGGADAELVASHLVQARGAAGDWAVPALRGAAGLARERGAPAAAVRYLR